MSVLAVAYLFCLPGGAVLFVLAGEAVGLSFEPVSEVLLILASVWLATMLMVSSWGFLRCVGWALAMVGYAILANALSPERSLGAQYAWIGFFGAAGVVLGLAGPRSHRVFLWVRRRPGEPSKPDATARQAPWPQFRLRSLLVLVAVACLILGAFTREHWGRLQQRRVAARVEAAGGHVSWADARPSTPTAALFRLEDLLRRDWLLGDAHRKEVAFVWLGPLVGDDGLSRFGLEALPAPFDLDLSDSEVSDAGLACLQRVACLQKVTPPETVGDVGFEHLSQVKGLKCLELSRTRPSAAGMAHLGRCVSLVCLRLCAAPVGDEHVAQLKDLQRLEELFLDRTNVADAGLAEIAQLRGLKTLNLSSTKVTDAGLRHLAGHPRLESLYLFDTRITDAGLVYLGEMPGLKLLELSGTQVTTAGAARFRQARPKVNVGHSPVSRTAPSKR
jgi:hypothetical protein